MFRRILTPALLTVLVLFGAACSGNKVKDTDTISVEPDPTPELPVEDIMDAQITSRGIGPIRTDMRIVDMKPSVENLYDTIVREGGYESNSYHFFLDGQQRFTVYEFESGIANVICVDDSSVVVNNPGGGNVRLGDSFTKVFSLDGVKPQWECTDDEGMWVWNWQGLWFQPDQSQLNDVLVHKLYNQNTPPSNSDFTPEVTVGYIGTGLPW